MIIHFFTLVTANFAVTITDRSLSDPQCAEPLCVQIEPESESGTVTTNSASSSDASLKPVAYAVNEM